MQAEREFTKVAPHRLVQEFPAPLCRTCNVSMWVIRREGEADRRLSRFGFNCRVCGETLRHGRRERAAA